VPVLFYSPERLPRVECTRAWRLWPLSPLSPLYREHCQSHDEHWSFLLLRSITCFEIPFDDVLLRTGPCISWGVIANACK